MRRRTLVQGALVLALGALGLAAPSPVQAFDKCGDGCADSCLSGSAAMEWCEEHFQGCTPTGYICGPDEDECLGQQWVQCYGNMS